MPNSSKHRIELFFKNPQDLQQRVRWLQSHGFTAFNLVNKNQQDTVEEWVQCILEEVGEADVCAHYSLKYNKVARKGIAEHRQRLTTFLQRTKAQEVLLVSGSGKTKAAWNTVQALQEGDMSKTRGVKLAVAYNPYFPDPGDQAIEDQRLLQKLNTNRVDKVYLQFGTDLIRLKNALTFLQSQVKKNTNSTGTSSSIAGSLFLPTSTLIAQQKFRPWNGVFLSPEFLSGPQAARSIVLEMMKLYQSYDVEMLWEAPGIRTEKDLQVMKELLEELHASTSNPNHDNFFATPSLLASSGENPTSTVLNSTSTFPMYANRDDSPGSNACTQSNITTSMVSDSLQESETSCGIIWFGSHDVRLRDNQALENALRHHSRVVPVFLWTQQHQRGKWGVRGAMEVILKEAFQSLEVSLQHFDLKLICRNCEDDGCTELLDIVHKTGATAVYWNREHTPESHRMETTRKRVLQEHGITVMESQSSLLYDPECIVLDTGFQGGHWGTLMPFVKSCKKTLGAPRRPTPYHETFRLLQEAKGCDEWPESVPVKDLKMAQVKSKVQWDLPIRERFIMSEEAAKEMLDSFFHKGLRRYETERSRADKEFATSRLSPHLRVGTLSPNELYWRTEDCGLGYEELKTFSRRLFWRDLAYYQLKCFPDMRNVPIRKHYQQMEWITGEEEKRRFEAWKSGKSGYPIVDAGMRELYATGWMNQSIRMVVASFLVEYLRVSWVKGCEWFHYTLADADSAINAMMWNNAGKSGIDQWNFVLSPVAASQDPSGDYTRKWVPELAALPSAGLVHRPWEAPNEVLERAGVILGTTYPHRVITNLKEERAKSVESTLEMRRNSQHANTDRGYDLIRLPNGKETVVFTKKEYRIDGNGNLMSEVSSNPPTAGRQRKRTRKA